MFSRRFNKWYEGCHWEGRCGAIVDVVWCGIFWYRSRSALEWYGWGVTAPWSVGVSGVVLLWCSVMWCGAVSVWWEVVWLRRHSLPADVLLICSRFPVLSTLAKPIASTLRERWTLLLIFTFDRPARSHTSHVRKNICQNTWQLLCNVPASITDYTSQQKNHFSNFLKTFGCFFYGNWPPKSIGELQNILI